MCLPVYNRAMAITLFTIGVAALMVAFICYYWIKWRVWRSGGKVRYMNFGGWAAEVELFRDFRTLAEEHGWAVFPLHALFASMALGAFLVFAALLAK